MTSLADKRLKRIRRHRRARAKVGGTSERPRISVFRSNRHIWAQLIDDEAGKTIVSASDREVKQDKKSKSKKVPLAGSVGELIAKKAGAKKILSVVFDRGGYKYHGMVKAVAEGARKGGLKF